MIIYKYRIDPRNGVTLPPRSIPLSVGEQSGDVMLWAIVPFDVLPGEPRRFTSFGTGDPLPEDILYYQFQGTVQMQSGLVWHVFEVIEKYQPSAIERHQ